MSKNDDWVRDHWPDLRSSFIKRWPEIDDSVLDSTQLDFGQLVGLLQKHYGIPLDIAARQVADLAESLRCD